MIQTIQTDKKIEINESELMDFYILLVEKDMEILKKLKDASELKTMKEFAKQSLKIHEKMDKLSKLLGLDAEED